MHNGHRTAVRSTAEAVRLILYEDGRAVAD